MSGIVEMSSSTAPEHEPAHSRPQRRAMFSHTVPVLQRVEFINYGIVSQANIPEAWLDIIRPEQTATTLESGLHGLEPERVSSASTVERNDEEATVYNDVVRLLRGASLDDLDQGEESHFYAQLSTALGQYGSSAVDVIAGLVFTGNVGSEVSSIVLEFLGQIDHPLSRDTRRRVLLKGLRAHSHWVRDGASLGLAWLSDPSTVGALRDAVESEKLQALQRSMRKILGELEREHSDVALSRGQPEQLA